MDFFFLNSKRTFVILFLVCLGMMAVALFMEHILMLKPCMLCYMQRGDVILVGLIAGIGFLINSEKLIVYKGFVIGWFSGSLEFGPRSLGSRSIIADPRDEKMQRNLNLKIKKRESFRPFAPAILEEDFKREEKEK